MRGIAPSFIDDAGNWQSWAFLTEKLSVSRLSLNSIQLLIEDPAGFPLLAAINKRTCGELDLEVLHTPRPSNPDHFEILLEAHTRSQRQKKAKQLKVAAVVVGVRGSVSEVYEELRARCEEYDRRNRSGV